MSRFRPRTGPVVVVGLAVALLLGMVVANVADPNPDGLERALIDVHCGPGADEDACLDELVGEPVFRAAPLPDYQTTWLSGLLGVTAAFLLGAGLLRLVRRPDRADDLVDGGGGHGHAAP
jgi:hypothetical protein